MDIFVEHIVSSMAVLVGVLALLIPLLRSSKSQTHIPDRFNSVAPAAVQRKITPSEKTA